MTGPDFRVTLLGTGVPIPSPDRFGPCTLVEAGDQKFLIDAGRGATIRLYQLKLPIGRIDVQLLTHYHSDHTSGVPDVWLTGWLESHFGTRKAPYRVIGPTGARELIENLERAYALDIKIRVADEKLPLCRHRDGRHRVRSRRHGLREGRREGDRLRGRPRRCHQAVLRLPLRIRRPRRGVFQRHALQSECHQLWRRCRPAGARGCERAAGTDEGGLYPEDYRPPHDAAGGRTCLCSDKAEACRLYAYRSARQRAYSPADDRRYCRRDARNL